MTIIERLEDTILRASESGASIEEIDLTENDYAELMAFAGEYDDAALLALMLDMSAKTYKGYPLRYRSAVSHAELENGEAIALVNSVDGAAD